MVMVVVIGSHGGPESTARVENRRYAARETRSTVWRDCGPRTTLTSPARPGACPAELADGPTGVRDEHALADQR